MLQLLKTDSLKVVVETVHSDQFLYFLRFFLNQSLVCTKYLLSLWGRPHRQECFHWLPLLKTWACMYVCTTQEIREFFLWIFDEVYLFHVCNMYYVVTNATKYIHAVLFKKHQCNMPAYLKSKQILKYQYRTKLHF